MASMFLDEEPFRTSLLRDFLSLKAFSLTLLVGKNYKQHSNLELSILTSKHKIFVNRISSLTSTLVYLHSSIIP